MKRLIVPICLLLLSTSIFAQSRSRTTRRGTQSSRTKPAASAAASQIKIEGATRVATQIKNLTTFLYLLGGVAKDIDAQDAASRSGQGSPTIERNKAKLKSTFEDFRVALDNLEIYFRSTPELEPYYVKLVGSASGAATAEDQAAAGHTDQAGHTLLGVVNRLADVLVAMR
jgi:hypothetical protein